MGTIPTIGGAGGIFEVFVPGLFLLLNFIGVAYFFPYVDEDAKKYIWGLVSNPGLSVIIAVGFGYLMGVILRMFRAEASDKWSGKFLRVFNSNCRKKESRDNLYGYEDFPYTGWLGVLCQKAWPKETLDFYYNFWAKFQINEKTIIGLKSEKDFDYQVPDEIIKALEQMAENPKLYRNKGDFLEALRSTIGEEKTKRYEEGILRYACLWAKQQNRAFFNYCKTMIMSSDTNLANEIISRASLSRYISGMFYALVLTSFLIAITLLLQSIMYQKIVPMLIFILCMYVLAIIGILRNLRLMRVAEASIVFVASFKNKSIFLNNNSAT